MRSTVGRMASSRMSAAGSGQCGVVMRTERPVEIVERLVGDDRHDLRAPAAQPRIFLDAEAAMRLGDRAEDGLGVERHERAHVDHLAVDAVLGGELLGRRKRARHHQGERNDGGVLAGAENFGGAERVENLAVRHLALGGVERLVLEEDDRVRDRAPKPPADPMTSTGLDGATTLRPGIIMHQFSTLCECCAPKREPAPFAGAHHQRALGLPVGHVAALGEFVGDVVEADREEIREHDLGDRLQPGHRRAHRGAENGLLGDRRVAHAQRPELLVEARPSP